MHVYCDLFDMLDFAERNEDFCSWSSYLSLLSKASGIHEISYYFVYAWLVYFPYACVDVISIAMLKLFRVAPLS